MAKIKHWWPLPVSLLATGLLVSAALWIDLQCTPISTKLCLAWNKFNWETVLAGTIGLLGGLFVITSTRIMIENQRTQSIQTAIDREIFVYLDIVAESRRYLEILRIAINTVRSEEDEIGITESENINRIIENKQNLRTIEKYRHHLDHHINENLDVPPSIATELEELVDYMGMFDDLTGHPNESLIAKTFEMHIINFENAVDRYRQRLIETRTRLNPHKI